MFSFVARVEKVAETGFQGKRHQSMSNLETKDKTLTISRQTAFDVCPSLLVAQPLSGHATFLSSEPEIVYVKCCS